MTTLELVKVGSLFYPVILAQMDGRISEARAAELLNITIAELRQIKTVAIEAVEDLIQKLPSPLSILSEHLAEKTK